MEVVVDDKEYSETEDFELFPFPDVTCRPISAATISNCHNIHVGNKIYYCKNEEDPDAISCESYNLQQTKVQQEALTNTSIQELQGYLRNQFSNRQAWICPIPSLANECHINDIFVSPYITRIALNRQKVKIDDIFSHDKNSHPPKRILVQGEPGSGKTTLLSKLAFDWATQKNGYLSCYDFVFLLKLKKLDLDIHDALANQIFHDTQWESSKDIIWEYIRQHQQNILFLFDGYDEMTEEQKKQGTLKRLCEGITVPLATVIITSRPLTSIDIIKDCDQKFTIQGISVESIDEYVLKFQRKYYVKDLTEEAFHIFFSNFLSCNRPVFKSLTQNPLILYLLCTLLHEQFDTVTESHSRTGIYLKICKYLIQSYISRNRLIIAEEKLFVETYEEFGSLCYNAIKLDQNVILHSEVETCKTSRILKDLGLFCSRMQKSFTRSELSPAELIHLSFFDFSAAFFMKQLYFKNKEKFLQELLLLTSNGAVKREILVRDFFCFLIGLLKDDAHEMFNALPPTAYFTLTSSEVLHHLCTVILECGATEPNLRAIQRFIPSCLSLNTAASLYSLTSFASGLNLILNSELCKITRIILSADAIVSCYQNNREAFCQFLSALHRNKSVKHVELKMYTDRYEAKGIVEAGFSELCQFALSDKELDILAVIFDPSLQNIAEQVYILIKNQKRLMSLSVESCQNIMDVKTISNIASSANRYQSLNSLSLKGVHLTPDTWGFIIKILLGKKVCNFLLSYTKTENEKLLLKGFKFSLKKSFNSFTDSYHSKHLHQMCCFIQNASCCLQSLTLVWHSLTAVDLSCLASSLCNNSSLKMLKLHNCVQKLSDLIPLLEKLTVSKNLTLSELYINFTLPQLANEKTVEALCSCLQSSSLQKLGLQGWKLKCKSKDLFVKVVKSIYQSSVVQLRLVRFCIYLAESENSQLSSPSDRFLLKKGNHYFVDKNSIHISSKLEYFQLNVSLETKSNVLNCKTNWICQLNCISMVTSLKTLHISEIAEGDDDLFILFCLSLKKLINLQYLCFENSSFKLENKEKCLDMFGTCVSKLKLNGLKLENNLFPTYNETGIFIKDRFFYDFINIAVSSISSLRDISFNWLHIFPKGIPEKRAAEDFIGSLKINHTFALLIKEWPVDMVRTILEAGSNFDHLKVVVQNNEEIIKLVFMTVEN